MVTKFFLYCLIATHKSLILAGVLLTPRKKGQVTERNNLAGKLGWLPLSSIRSWTFGPIMFFTTLNFSSNPRIKEMIALDAQLSVSEGSNAYKTHFKSVVKG